MGYLEDKLFGPLGKTTQYVLRHFAGWSNINDIDFYNNDVFDAFHQRQENVRRERESTRSSHSRSTSLYISSADCSIICVWESTTHRLGITQSTPL
jgi:hypothetical protein